MKRYLISLAILLSLTSCLDENPRDRVDEPSAYATAQDIYVNTVATLYSHIGGNTDCQGLQGTVRGVYDYNTFSTDEAIVPTRGGDWQDGGFWQNLYRHQWTAADASLAKVWDYLYWVIMLSNRSLQAIDQHRDRLGDAQYAAFTAEVRAIRAMYYYYAMDLFGNVPLVTSASASLSSVKQTGRSSVMRFVVSELQQVAPLLPNEHSNLQGDYYGRVTRPVAHFLLAKLALNAPVYAHDDWTDGSAPSGSEITFEVGGRQLNAYQACVAYCDSITAAGYSLAPSYASNFSVHNETSPENIFIIPMDKTLYSNAFYYLFRSRHYSHGQAMGMDAENGPSATVSCVNAFGYGTPEQDARYDINFYSDTVKVNGKVVTLDDGSPLIYMPLKVKLDLTGDPYEKTAGARMHKYEVDMTAYDNGKYQDNDIVLFRYADVLLMRAEALVRNGEDGSADLNAVRRRVGMPERVATLDNILQERLLELVWEGWRRQDLVRFGRFTEAYDQRTPLKNEHSGYTTVFPIPNKALQLNSSLRQNPGY